MTDIGRRTSYVVGPNGESLTLANLPQPQTRWIAQRKAEVVNAVTGGLLTMQDACTKYSISVEEFVGWEVALKYRGLNGLYASRGLRTPRQHNLP